MLKFALAAIVGVVASMIPVEGRGVQPVSIDFLSEGARVRGKFFGAEGGAPAYTLVLVPGWPGNPSDVLGLGAALSGQGVNVMMFNPPGLYDSEGMSSFPGTLKSIGAAPRWLEQPDVQTRFSVDTARVALGGHSFGGGMVMVYAAGDPKVRRVISIAGNDFGEFIREFQRNAPLAEGFRSMMLKTRAPEGPARFDFEGDIKELAEHQEVYGLRERALNLADRSLLLIGGWEDAQITVDQFLLPLYRALKRASASDVTFLVYHDDHGFGRVRARLASDIRQWLLRTEAR